MLSRPCRTRDPVPLPVLPALRHSMIWGPAGPNGPGPVDDVPLPPQAFRSGGLPLPQTLSTKTQGWAQHQSAHRRPRAAGALRRQSSTAAKHPGPEAPGQPAYPPQPLRPSVGRWRGEVALSEQCLPIPTPIFGPERTETEELGEVDQEGKVGEADQFLGSDSEGQAGSRDSICWKVQQSGSVFPHGLHPHQFDGILG